MNIEAIKELLEGFDPAAFLPQLDTLLGKIETILRVCVMAGPVILLVLGLAYLFLSPKEANHSFGYRCYFGMGSVEAWQFSQKLAGLVWSGLGLILTVVMLFLVNSFRGMESEAMVWLAGKCLIWEVGLILASVLGINITLAVLYDSKGYRRQPKAEEAAPAAPAPEAVPDSDAPEFDESVFDDDPLFTEDYLTGDDSLSDDPEDTE